MYAVETHCLCELLNRYVIITKHAIVSALLFSQSEQKVKSGICTIEYKTCTKGLRKKSLCVFNLRENYTRKYPMAQAVFVKTTQEKRRFIYYIISTGADAACIILAFWYYVGVLDRVRTEKKRGTERQENEPDAMRRAFTLAVLPPLAQRGNTGQRIHCKGDEQKNAIRFQVRYCGRGDCRRASAIRAHRVTTINNYYQLTRSAKNDKHEQQRRRRHREHRRHR